MYTDTILNACSVVKSNTTDFSGIIGCDKQIKQIKVKLAMKSSPCNFLFISPSGTGKTLLSRAIATHIGWPFIEINCASLKSIDQLLLLIETKIPKNIPVYESRLAKFDLSNPYIYLAAKQEYLKQPKQYKNQIKEIKHGFAKCVIFLDEMHGLKRGLQIELLTLISDGIILTKAVKHVFNLNQLCFLGATTDGGKLSQALRRRFIDIYLDYPSSEDKIKLIKQQLKPLVLQSDDLQILSESCINQDDCCKRIAALKEFRKYSGDNTLGGFLNYLNIDGWGLNKLQRECLLMLSEIADGKMSKQAIAQTLNIGEHDYEELVERPLLHRRLINIHPRGRSLSVFGEAVVYSWHSSA